LKSALRCWRAEKAGRAQEPRSRAGAHCTGRKAEQLALRPNTNRSSWLT
jgi:hypothetical protein